uniref:Beta-glucosidase 18-like n=1 Tax=Rhizophora mucronata TaxID=61149 RepID=A0A2P2KYB9_RHIMU
MLLDPIVHGDYPPEMRHYLGKTLPRFSEEEVKYVKGSADFIGINHYTTLYAKDCIHSACESGWDRPIRGFVYPTGVRNGILIGEPAGNPRFFVVPRGMEKIVNYVKERYNNMPMFITENGFSPPPQEHEPVEDLLEDAGRIHFHKSYLAALARAIRNGADVRGYFAWSLIDNFEWMEGYSARYGLYYVDRRTLKRIPKHSAKWYKDLITNVSEEDFAAISLSDKRMTYSPSDSEAAKAET